MDAGLAHPAKSLVSAGICVAEASRQGECMEFSNRLNETSFYPVDGRANGGKDVVNRPLRSTYEDLGEMLVELSATYPALKDVNQQVMSKVQSGHRQYADKVHLPLIAGMMQGFVKSSNRVNNATIVPQNIVQYLFEADWYDLNDATQRRMHKQAHEFSRTFHRGVQLPANFDPTFPEDKAKVERFKKYQNAFQGAHYADTIYNAAMLAGFGLAVANLGKKLVTMAINCTTTGRRVLTVSRVKAYFKLREIKKAAKGKTTKVANATQQEGAGVKQVQQRVAQPRGQSTPRSNGGNPQATQGTPTATRPQAGGATGTEPIVNLPQAKGASQGITLTGRVTPDPVAQQQAVIGTLDAQVDAARAGSTPVPSTTKSFGQRVKDFWTDYRMALRNSNALQSGIPGIPAPGTFGAARAGRLMEEAAARAEELLSGARRDIIKLRETSVELTRSSGSAFEGLGRVEGAINNFKYSLDRIYFNELTPARELHLAFLRSEEVANLQAQAQKARNLLKRLDDISAFMREDAAALERAQQASTPMKAGEVASIGEQAASHWERMDALVKELEQMEKDLAQAHKGVEKRIWETDATWAKSFDPKNVTGTWQNGSMSRPRYPEPYEGLLNQLDKSLRDIDNLVQYQLYETNNALQTGRNTTQVLSWWKGFPN